MSIADKIASIASHDELDGYAAQASARGLRAGEQHLIAQKRKELGARKK